MRPWRLLVACLIWVAGCSASTAPPVAPTATAVPAQRAAPTATTAAAKPVVAATAPAKPAAAAPTAAAKPVAKPSAAIVAGNAGACMVGNWVVSNVTITDAAGQQSGGAGAQWEISSSGALKETLDGSQPILSASGGGIRLSGSFAATIQLPQDPNATSGAWVASNIDNSQQTTAVIGPNGTAVTIVTGNKVLAANGNVIATIGPSNAVNTGSTWNCSGNTLTVQVNGATARGTGQTVTTLTRK